MSPRRWSVLLLPLFITAPPISGQRNEIWFPTDEPEFQEPSNPTRGGQAFLTANEYEVLVKDWSGNGITLREVPPGLSSRAGFGFNFVFGGKNRHFIVDGSRSSGYVLYADLNANGSLVDDEPLRLQSVDKYFTTMFETQVTENTVEGDCTYPVRIRFVVRPQPAGDRLGWATYETTTRRGLIQLGDLRLQFAVTGSSGLYDGASQIVWFDLDGDGRGWNDPESNERFLVADKRVTIDDVSYEFRVDRYGRSLGLLPLDQRLPSRPTLRVGTEAPNLTAVDTNGQTVELRDLRGSVVLLDFWTEWCGPCRLEAPRLVDLYQQYQAQGFVILGVSPDSPDDIRKFVTEFHHTWPQLSEPFDGPVHRSYRVVAYPTHYLIDRDGAIVVEAIDWATVEMQIQNVFAAPYRQPSNGSLQRTSGDRLSLMPPSPKSAARR